MKNKKDYNLGGFNVRGFLFAPRKGYSPGSLAEKNKGHTLPGDFLFYGML